MRFFIAFVFAFFAGLAMSRNIPHVWDIFDIAAMTLFIAAVSALIWDYENVA